MNLIPFESQGWKIRAIEIDGDPWFVAVDVARSLGYSDPHGAIRKHCKGVSKTNTPSGGGEQEAKIIPERDVYRLIMRSKLPEAERFEEWVVGVVLPQIRKTGSYELKGERLIAAALIEAQKVLESQKPAVEFYQAVTGSKSAIPMSQAAKVLDMGVGRNKLFSFLRAQGVLMHNNEPYQEYVDRGWFRVVEQKYQKSDGEVCVNFKTLVYQRGLDGIRKMLSKELEDV